MARFYGAVGYGHTIDAGNGVHTDSVQYRMYYGDVVRNLRINQDVEKVNDDLSVSNSISILSDDYANKNFSAIRYVEWAGTRWAVSSVEVQSPRLLLRLGGLYNGPQGTAAVTP